MANIFDYMEWRGDLSLQQSAFNDVDSLILCRLSYIPMDDIVPGINETGSVTIAEAAAGFMEKIALKNPDPKYSVLLKDDKKLITRLAECERYASMRLFGYVNIIDYEKQKQFAAICILPGDGSLYIAYRGTDDTIVGWKEDFNMGFLTPVPSQEDAVKYLESAAALTTESIRLGGHSKGGNLAVYAAAYCDKNIQDRIIEIYNNDGPGFRSEVMNGSGYTAIKTKIKTFVPQSSLVGMLLEHEEEYTVVHARQIGLLQHDLYSWDVKRNSFVYLDSMTNSSRYLNQTLREWIGSMDEEQRERYVTVLYEIICATQAKTFGELLSGWYKNIGLMHKSLKNTDEATKKLISQSIALFFKSAGKNFPSAFNKPNNAKPSILSKQVNGRYSRITDKNTE